MFYQKDHYYGWDDSDDEELGRRRIFVRWLIPENLETWVSFILRRLYSNTDYKLTELETERNGIGKLSELTKCQTDSMHPSLWLCKCD